MDKFRRYSLNPDCQAIGFAGLDKAGDIKAEAPEHAGVGAKILSIEPDITGVIDAVEDQLKAFARPSGRRLEVKPIPPVLLRHVCQARVASAIPKRLQLMRRFQVGLDIARHSGRDPAGRRHISRVQSLCRSCACRILTDVPVRAAQRKRIRSLPASHIFQPFILSSCKLDLRKYCDVAG